MKKEKKIFVDKKYTLEKILDEIKETNADRIILNISKDSIADEGIEIFQDIQKGGEEEKKEILKPDSSSENVDSDEGKKSPISENIKKLKDALEKIAPNAGEEYLFEMPKRGNIKIKNEGAGVFSFGEKGSLKYNFSENEVEKESASTQDRLKSLLQKLSAKKTIS